MEMSTEIGILLAYALGIFALYVIGYMFLVPIKILLRLVINSIAGALAILVINWAGAFWGLHISLNVLSAVIVGLLGIPGALFLAGYHYFGL
jgi:inhibitor of the pro-sigma K processing machinery